MRYARLDGWVPIRLAWHERRAMIDWCHLGRRRFTEPFFDNTIDACLRDPCELVFRHLTPIEVLAERHASRPGVEPTGFIFHTSRCGSTLVAQMLAVLPQNIVISEASPIDGALRAHCRDPDVHDDQRVAWLRWMLSALGQPRAGSERQLFVKFDAWHALYLPLVRRAFPDVPWIFLYRDPVELLVGQLKQRGAAMVPGMVEFGLPEFHAEAIAGMSSEEYCARVLARICADALALLEIGDGKAVNYQQLPGAAWSTVADHFGIRLAPADIDRMREVANFDAKNPPLPFDKDGDRRKREANEAVRGLTAKFLRPLYERLEAVRDRG